MPRRIIIIGGGTAGASAAFAARKSDRTAEITVFSSESYPTYSRCGLPFAVKGIIPSFEKLVVFPESFFRQQKIELHKNTAVEKITPQEKAVIAGEKYNYDALVIATGARAIKPPLRGIDAPNIFVLRTITDAQQILQFAQSAKSAVIVGASFIGLELAEALKSKGLSIIVVETVRTMWRTLDEDMGVMVTRHLGEQGIRIIENDALVKIEGTKIWFKNETVSADMVIIAAGVRPESSLAKNAGIETGQTGGLKADERMETNIKGIYTAGDCAEVNSALTGEPILIGLGTIAARQGVAAGINAAGGDEKSPPVFNSAILKIFGMEIGTVGFTESYVSANNQSAKYHWEKFNPVSVLIKYPSLPHYYPGGVDVYTKLIADSATHRLIGGQIISKTSLAGRVNALSIAIEKKITVEELSRADFCYSPPVSDVWDPLAVAAQGLLRKLK